MVLLAEEIRQLVYVQCDIKYTKVIKIQKVPNKLICVKGDSSLCHDYFRGLTSLYFIFNNARRLVSYARHCLFSLFSVYSFIIFIIYILYHWQIVLQLIDLLGRKRPIKWPLRFVLIRLLSRFCNLLPSNLKQYHH